MELNNTLEVDITRLGQRVAHMGCCFYDGTVQIKDLFVNKKHRNKGLDEILLDKAHEYAHEKYADKIIAYCGAEPFCPDGQIPLEEEIAFYRKNGFVKKENTFANIP